MFGPLLKIIFYNILYVSEESWFQNDFDKIPFEYVKYALKFILVISKDGLGQVGHVSLFVSLIFIWEQSLSFLLEI